MYQISKYSAFITQRMTVDTQLANPDLLDWSIFLDMDRSVGPILHGMDRTLTLSRCLLVLRKECCWPSCACNKCVIDRAPGQYPTRYMPSRLHRSGMYWTVLPGCLVNNTYFIYFKYLVVDIVLFAAVTRVYITVMTIFRT